MAVPMLLVIQPLSEANLRISLALLTLAFLAWVTYRKRRSKLRNRPWQSGQENHCEKCQVQLEHQRRTEAKSDAPLPVVVTRLFRTYRKLPLRLLSRNLGYLFNTAHLFPQWVTWVVIWCYVRLFSCKLHEATRDKVTEYKTVGDFFTRTLKPGMRPIDAAADVVSPADGTVTHCGAFNGGFLEQVKGVHYSLNYFLGLENFEGSHERLHAGCDTASARGLLRNQDGSTRLYQWVIYLSPGDYHRFHSPAEWTVNKRR